MVAHKSACPIELQPCCPLRNRPRRVCSPWIAAGKPVLPPLGLGGDRFRCGGTRRLVTKLTSVGSASSSAATELEQDKQPVQWSKHWWPVQFVENLATDRPNRIQLLGRWLVAWKGKSGDWVVMEDACPHRLAPLSEGRIESDGNLLCAYHAWRFDEDGKCVEIPQADDAKSKSFACSSPRSCVKKYPCKAYGCVLWVWPDDAPSAIIDAAAAAIPMPSFLAKSIENGAQEGVRPGYTRVLPYSFDVLVENLFDPSHVIVAHHGLMGSSRYNARPLKMKPVDPLDTSHKDNTILAFEYESVGGMGGWSHVELSLPGCIHYRASAMKGGEKWFGQYLCAVPLEEGKSRAFAFGVSSDMLKGEPRRLPLPLKLMPWVVCHMMGSLFDGDSVFLRIQDEQLRRAGEETGRAGWRKYYMPTSADRGVAGFRKWMETEGGGGPKMPKGRFVSKSSTDEQRDVVLDRYTQHSRDCKTCQKGLAFVDKVVAVSQAAIAACILGLLLGGASRPVLGNSLLGVGACLGGLLRNWAVNEKKKFHFVDYVHADHD